MNFTTLIILIFTAFLAIGSVLKGLIIKNCNYLSCIDGFSFLSHGLSDWQILEYSRLNIKCNMDGS